MKISFIIPHLGVNGGTRRIVEVANRLQARGHGAIIFHPAGTPCEWIRCEVPIKSTKDALEESHDILIYADPSKKIDGVVRRIRARKKVFFILTLPFPADFLKEHRLKLWLSKDKRRFYLKKFLFSPHLKIAVSSGVQRYLRENFNINSELAISGVNTELFYPVDTQRNLKEIRVLYSGDPRSLKDTETIFTALEKVRQSYPNIILDSYHGLGIPQEGMAEKYSSADIFVDTQLHAGWNNPVAEAMACGVAVVCTDTLGGRDFVFNEKTALIVPFKDQDAVYNAVIRLIEDKLLRKTISENAYNQITQFTWDKSIDRLEGILLNI